MKNKTKIENNLRELRVSGGMSQREVARRLGFSSSDRISEWESGLRMPSVVNLFKLACLYHVYPNELYVDFWNSLAG